MEKITLLGNWVFLEPVKEETRLGFILPEHLQETNFGIVTAKGPGRKTKKGVTVPITVDIGDRLMIDPGCFRKEVEIDGKKHWLISIDNILAVMEPEELMN